MAIRWNIAHPNLPKARLRVDGPEQGIKTTVRMTPPAAKRADQTPEYRHESYGTRPAFINFMRRNVRRAPELFAGLA